MHAHGFFKGSHSHKSWSSQGVENLFQDLKLSFEKKAHSLKVENYVLFAYLDLAEDLSPRSNPLDSSKGLLKRGKGKARSFLQQKPDSWNIKNYC